MKHLLIFSFGERCREGGGIGSFGKETFSKRKIIDVY